MVGTGCCNSVSVTRIFSLHDLILRTMHTFDEPHEPQGNPMGPIIFFVALWILLLLIFGV